MNVALPAAPRSSCGPGVVPRPVEGGRCTFRECPFFATCGGKTRESTERVLGATDAVQRLTFPFALAEA